MSVLMDALGYCFNLTTLSFSFFYNLNQISLITKKKLSFFSAKTLRQADFKAS